ncbi:MAG: tRNA (N(6)-L-threonylcarbamoyladenosine(37)-C(2))-methylthiotransferase MtaB [Candidatus Omnitrophica bacterium]|nr:tRNA (N(6)-L-threonylcarbamoyladenosine(37)-C(2))-methylthiotransferase MtaB [Candidatus Omnitrophota bacterium]
MAIPTIFFYTIGCRLNASETAALQAAFVLDGQFRVVDQGDAADIVVINTCTVTGKGDADCRQWVIRLAKRNPAVRIALIGCQAQTQKDKLAAWPNVFWVVGTSRKMDLPAIIRETLGAEVPRPAVIVPEISVDNFRVFHPSTAQSRTRPNLKIQDGCDAFCAFCEVPFARGRSRSREFADLLDEARQWVGQGHKELVVTGVNIGAYHDQDFRLADVLAALLAINGLQRLRISSIEPHSANDAILDLMRTNPKFCRHLHIPLQSASDAVLQRMKRRHTFADVARFMERAKAAVPGICLGGDVIVGFPGETEERFAETKARLRDLAVDYLHVFSYSDREFAASKDFSPKVAPAIISQRSAVLRQLSSQKRRCFHQTLIGQKISVLFEEQKSAGWSGLTDNYVRVYAPNLENLANRLETVQILSLAREGVIGAIAAEK